MHTPGEWRVFDAEQPGIETGDFSIVVYGSQGEECGVRGNTPDEAQANAYLFAASSDLLAALKAMVGRSQYRSLEIQGETLPPAWTTIAMPSEEALNLARAAIAKAELSPDPSPGIS